MTTRIQSVIDEIKKHFPIEMRRLRVNRSLNTAYTCLEILHALNPRILKAAIYEKAEIAGLCCSINHDPGSIYMRVEFEKI